MATLYELFWSMTNKQAVPLSTEDSYLNTNAIPIDNNGKKEPFHLEVSCIESLEDANL